MNKRPYQSLYYKEKKTYESNVQTFKKMFHASEKIQIKHVQSLSDPVEIDPVTSTSTCGVLPNTDNHAVLQQILAKFSNLEQRLHNIEVNQRILRNGQENIVTNQEAVAKKLENIEENVSLLKPEMMGQTKALLECKVYLKSLEGLVCDISGEKPDSRLVEVAAMLPLKCVYSVQVMEEKLMSEDFAEATLTHVQKLKSESKDINKLIRCIFTDDLLRLYNWEGRRKKLPFGRLTICNRILRNAFKTQHAQEFENSIRKAIELSRNRVKDVRIYHLKRTQKIVTSQEAEEQNVEEIEENQDKSYEAEDNIERNQQILRNDEATIVTNQEAEAQNVEEIEENQDKSYESEDNIERNQQILRNDEAIFVTNQKAIAKNLNEIEENQHKSYEAEDNIERNQQILRNDEATIVTNHEAVAKNLEEIEENLTLKPAMSAQTKALLDFRPPLKRVEVSVSRVAGESPDLKLNEVEAMLPLRCVNSVNEIEEKLKCVDFAKAMLTYVQKLKGSSENINMRIMRGIFTDDLLDLYNWEGRWKKFPFGRLSICNRILREVFKNLSAQKFEKSIKMAIDRSHCRMKYWKKLRK